MCHWEGGQSVSKADVVCATLCIVEFKYFFGVVYTMDHEVIPRPSKQCDWTLKSSKDDLGLHQGKNGRVITEVEVHKLFFFKPTLSTVMVQRVFRWDKQNM